MELAKDVQDLSNENYKTVKKKERRTHSKIEKLTMFLDWELGRRIHIAKRNMQIQHNPSHYTNSVILGFLEHSVVRTVYYVTFSGCNFFLPQKYTLKTHLSVDHLLAQECLVMWMYYGLSLLNEG